MSNQDRSAHADTDDEKLMALRSASFGAIDQICEATRDGTIDTLEAQYALQAVIRSLGARLGAV